MFLGCNIDNFFLGLLNHVSLQAGTIIKSITIIIFFKLDGQTSTQILI